MSDGPKDPPIVNPGYVHGVNVIDFGEMRISRGRTERPRPHLCKHAHLIYDPQERRVQCSECEKDLDPFDALMVVVEQADRFHKQAKREKQRIEETLNQNLVSLAAKVMDKEWRCRDSVPCCPNCGEGILPEDVKYGVSSASKELTIQKRKNREPSS